MIPALNNLYQTILQRKQSADAGNSYTAQLLHKGQLHIAKKLGEEAVETAMAVAQNDRAQIIYESADLLFHWLVLLAATDISPHEIELELQRRQGTSGLTEKASRA
jgi:phosphoribosyl-ATP pyrophosphohydrolase